MEMLDRLMRFILQTGLPPHGFCLLWDPGLVWTHVIADALIAMAYYSIPVVLWLFLRRRPDLEFGWVLGLFALFILACGTTHLISILVLWVPAYGIEALVKVITAGASIVTAIVLWPLLPKLVAVPSPSQLQSALDRLHEEVAERQRAEEMLRQSLKMQAVGQLTAGIAHDFNNLLTIINGNLERLKRGVDDEHKAARSIENALSASERAARLTGQLLAFARKQPLLIVPVDVNQAVCDLVPLIEQTTNGKMTIETDLWPASLDIAIDKNQFDGAILNLALNARDAMPAGGLLRITTALEGGSVAIFVKDQGVGMDSETISRAVEPFFTTKPVGSGTGLGLSQVFGFVVQSGGQVKIESEPGTGTSVKLSFPRRVGGADEASAGC
ncbi:ATP-binding protein [Novosphingobium subterraneum]|uniref:histidine kinase n=1 Tax=Novosphingobium subterraneum TaxID=48936 RepID=A0A0B8ZG90_9SPHN|nr:ATP-binding protein [Novosphingobium subterraneum]KHS42015.1 integral membrane sensor hybrid histidine kinase [Novosphingobium subterraneum]